MYRDRVPCTSLPLIASNMAPYHSTRTSAPLNLREVPWYCVAARQVRSTAMYRLWYPGAWSNCGQVCDQQPSASPRRNYCSTRAARTDYGRPLTSRRKVTLAHTDPGNPADWVSSHTLYWVGIRLVASAVAWLPGWASACNGKSKSDVRARLCRQTPGDLDRQGGCHS